MHHARVPPLLWFYVMLHLANSAVGANAGFLSRHVGIDTGSAQRMLLHIRLHLAALDFQPVIGAANDDIFLRIERIRGVYHPSSTRRNVGHVLFIAGPSGLASIVIDPRRAWRLRGLISARIHRGARIWNDCYQSFRIMARYNEDRPCTVSFAPTYFADRPQFSDPVQAFVSSFRHGFRTQHQHVQGNFLWLYLSEYLFRFNRRWRSEEIFADMVARFPALDPETRRLLTASHCDLPVEN
jgi:transposase